MFNYQDFDDVFDFDPDYSYDQDSIHAIDANRKEFDGLLFIDKVLKLLGIKRPLKHYPPKSNSNLRDLHKLVCDNPGADHHKISILYYFLIDIDYVTGRRDFSTAFERKAFLPQKYGIYMKGLWHLDHQEYELAVQYLTHPSLTPTFSDDILEVLVRKCKEPTLALAWYYTAQPTLTTGSAIECLFVAISKTSVSEAFYFAREQSTHAHRHLFEILISNVIHNSTTAQIADRATELVRLPLNAEEEAWFNEYLTWGDGARFKKAKDTLMMRKIGTGRFHECLDMKGIHGKSIGGLNWGELTEAVEKGMGPRMGV